MQERIDPIAYTAERFLKHIQETANSIGAPFSATTTRRCLEVFAPEFEKCVVQMKATDKPGSGLYYRFFYNGPNDLTQRAINAWMLNSAETPNLRLQADVLAAFPSATRAGLDFDSLEGLAKIWTFTGGPVPVEELFALPSIPQSVRDHAEFFRQHRLQNVFFVASDYQGSTMNVYFGWENECRNIEWIEQMVAATGGARPSRELCEEMLRTQAASGGVGMTFSWDAPHLRRWCLYSLEVPLAPLQSPGVTLPLRLQYFLKAPSLNLEAQFNVAWSFGGSQTYIKVEKSYARDATYFLTEQMGGDLTHPTSLEHPTLECPIGS